MAKVTCTVKVELKVDVEHNWDDNQSLGTIRREAAALATSAIADSIKNGKLGVTPSVPGAKIGEILFSSTPDVVVTVVSNPKIKN